MRRLTIAILLILWLAAPAAAAGQDVWAVNGRFSIDAKSVPISQLLRYIDQVTGMRSKIPADVAHMTVSVVCNDVDFEEAVRKIFEGVPLDYVVLGTSGIIVVGRSNPAGLQQQNTAPVPAAAAAPRRPEISPEDRPDPFGALPKPGDPPTPNPFAALPAGMIPANAGQPGQAVEPPVSPFSRPLPAFGSNPPASPAQPENSEPQYPVTNPDAPHAPRNP